MTKRKPCKYCGRPCGRSAAIWHRLEPGPNGCLMWTGRLLNGYGVVGGRLVHRVVYREVVGDFPNELQLDHLCRTPRCANPYHLEPVTRQENVDRAWAGYTHCKHGHEFTVANTQWTTQGARKCRICVAAAQRRYQKRLRAAGVTRFKAA